MRLEINVKDQDYSKLISFIEKNKCKILIDHKLRVGHMMTVNAPSREVAMEIINRKFKLQDQK
jgi:hypothetical protein